MKHISLPSTRTSAALSLLSVFALVTQAAPLTSAQSFPTDEQIAAVAAQGDAVLHSGAPLDYGKGKGIDKGKPAPRPPSVPQTGPDSLFALALIAGAGVWTYRKSMHLTGFAQKKV